MTINIPQNLSVHPAYPSIHNVENQSQAKKAAKITRAAIAALVCLPIILVKEIPRTWQTFKSQLKKEYVERRIRTNKFIKNNRPIIKLNMIDVKGHKKIFCENSKTIRLFEIRTRCFSALKFMIIASVKTLTLPISWIQSTAKKTASVFKALSNL
jgi:hypothetical protein